MNFRVPLLIAALALLAAACSSDTESAKPRLAIIDSTGNIALIDPVTEDRIRVTTNAASDLAYFQPVWSPTGHLFVYSEATPEGSRLVLVDEDKT